MPNSIAQGSPAPPPHLTHLANREGYHSREWNRPTLSHKRSWEWLTCAAIVGGLAVLVHAAVRGGVIGQLAVEAENYPWARAILRPAMLWGLMGALLLVLRTALWLQ